MNINDRIVVNDKCPFSVLVGMKGTVASKANAFNCIIVSMDDDIPICLVSSEHNHIYNNAVILYENECDILS